MIDDRIQLFQDTILLVTANVFTGQSTITFIYDFVERFKGPHPGYAVVSGRPQAGTLIVIHVIQQLCRVGCP